jgi:hypothetical protein
VTLLNAVTARYTQASEPLRTERRVEILAVLVLLLIGLQLLSLAAGSLFERRIDPVLPTPDSLQIADATGMARVEAGDTRDLLARPLFWVSRRPEQGALVEPEIEEVQASGSAAPKLKELRITGVFGAGAAGGAIVNYRGQLRRVRVGEELDGWTLDSVSPTAVSFASAGVVDSRDLLPASLSAIEGAAAEGASEGSGAASPAAQQGGTGAQDGASGSEGDVPASPVPRPAPTSIARPVTRGRSAK